MKFDFGTISVWLAALAPVLVLALALAIGTRGVFLIETKARRRRASRNGQPEHEVIYDGEFLQFPFYRDSKPIEQAKINAK